MHRRWNQVQRYTIFPRNNHTWMKNHTSPHQQRDSLAFAPLQTKRSRLTASRHLSVHSVISLSPALSAIAETHSQKEKPYTTDLIWRQTTNLHTQSTGIRNRNTQLQLYFQITDSVMQKSAIICVFLLFSVVLPTKRLYVKVYGFIGFIFLVSCFNVFRG